MNTTGGEETKAEGHDLTDKHDRGWGKEMCAQ